MKFALTASGILIATLLISCGDKDAETEHVCADDHASHSAITTTVSDGLDGLILNKGSKWEMDGHTKDIFAKMAESFLDLDHASLNEAGLKQAGADLQRDINELIQGCTMSGDAHNQLHVYLTGYIPAVADLSEFGRTDDAEKVKHYLEKYDKYFE
jgi:hypothetical protein